MRDSGAARVDEGFWVAVLPFKYTGAEHKALADGLSEEIVAGMGRFSYLRVITHGSTQRYADQSPDLRTVGKELGARYVMNGNLRQLGTRLRVAVQLADAATGAQLWAETYERPFSPETAFELQDELVPCIVSTVADMYGVLPRSMSAAVRFKPSDQLTPYEALLRGFGHSLSFSAGDVSEVRSCLERAVQQSPGNADCLAMLSNIQANSYGVCDNVSEEILGGALEAAQAAVEAAPTNGLAYHALAVAWFFKKNLPAFRAAAERAISLNPMDGATIAYMGILMAFTGDWERGIELTEKGMQLNANHPGWHLMTGWHDAYRVKDYAKALELALKLNAPKNPWVQRSLTVSYAQLGMSAEAGSALGDLLALVPHFAQVAREMHSRWLEPGLVEHMLEGLRKAGLEIPAENEATSLRSGASSSATKSESGATRAAAREDEGFWVAVLPFKYTGSDADLKALAEGLSEEVVTGLSRFSYLRVIARGSTAKYSSESGDVRAIGKELGARYVMEGSLRLAGTTLRIAVQLVDASSGAHLWAQTYERTFRAEDVFAVQDDITDRVVATVADANGVLARSIAAGVEEKPEATLTALDWTLRCLAYRRNITPETHARLRDGLERFVEREAKHADAWACLALLYADEFSFGFNPRTDALERSLAAARHSIKIDRSCQIGNSVLAQVHFYRRDVPAFRAAAEGAIALNPRNTEVLAQTALLWVFSREGERGANLARRAMDLNPHHPGWYHVALVWDHFQKGEYEQALAQESRINIPGLFWQPLAVAACCGLLGRTAEAAAAVEELRRLDKDIEQHLWRHIETYNYASGFMDRILEGLAKAGLHITVPGGASAISDETHARDAGQQIAEAERQPVTSGAMRASSGETRADEGFWVAVLPFKYDGGNADLRALAGGLTDDIVTGMSRFSYLRVIARGSTAKYSSESGDVRAIGKQLGARYVMEGSLRQAGSKLRLAVQLVDTVSGAHLWAETYEHAFAAESVFEVQDNLVPRIVSTVADQYGVLPRSMSEVLRSKKDEDLTPHEAVLRVFSYFTRLTSEEHAAVRTVLERAVQQAPYHADSWAMLSMIYRGEFAQGFNAGPNPLDRALAAAQRAVDLAATHALGHYALATVYFFRKEMVAFHVAAERAMELNPLDASVKAYLGLLIAATGEWDRGCQMVEAAMQLNPNCPGYFYFARCCNAYRQGKYDEVLEAATRGLPSYFHTHALRAAALGQLGRQEEARKAVQDLLALRPISPLRHGRSMRNGTNPG